jgi:hypothetical protein
LASAARLASLSPAIEGHINKSADAFVSSEPAEAPTREVCGQK